MYFIALLCIIKGDCLDRHFVDKRVSINEANVHYICEGNSHRTGTNMRRSKFAAQICEMLNVTCYKLEVTSFEGVISKKKLEE